MGHEPHIDICDPLMLAICLEDVENGGSPAELRRALMKNILMMMDHFTRYALAVVTKDQTAKTVVKVFYKCFIAVFRVPAKLLSNRGANFTSALAEELCAAFGIQKCRTTAYHAQCNGQVEHFHQMLFHMIGKLARDKKA